MSGAWHRPGRKETRSEHTLRGYNPVVSESAVYTVAGMHCGHCERAVKDEVAAVPGVASVDVDLETKLVTVTGDSLDDAALRAAIEEAGYVAA